MTQQDVAILDFGSSTITILIGQRGINNTLTISGKGETEYAGYGEGEFFRPEQLGQAVAHAINIAETTAKTKITKLYVGVPGDFTVCVCKDVERTFDNIKHKITAADIEELHEQGNTFYRDPAVKVINIQPVYYTLSNERRLIEPVGLVSSKLGGHISYLMAETKFINTVDSIMNALGIAEVEYVSSILAETLFLFDEVKRDQYVVLLDVGYITTSVAVARGDGILSLHSFSLGGGNIAGDLANYFQISYAEAEALKRRVTLTLSMGPDDYYEVTDRYPAALVNEIVTARIGSIAKTVQKCLDLNEYVVPNNIPYSLTGGGVAYMRGAKEVLSDMLQRRVEVVAPRIPQMEVPGWSSSLGLLDLAIKIQEPQKQGFLDKVKKLFKK
ncbi:MAG: hypothetical protein J1F36_02330 [Clostridiales bacterium]|nr:hypothetical protein [Clostridiales bacterium]